MVGNLNINQISEGQDDKEITINLATLKIDNAMTDTADQDLTSGNVSISLTDWENNIHFKATNATVVGRTVTVQQTKRMVVLESDSTNTEDVDFVRGSSTITLSPGDAVVAYTDGTANGLTQVGSSSAAGIYDFFVYFEDKPPDAGELMRIVAVRSFTLPSGLTISQGFADTVSAAAVTFPIHKNGISVGTVNFALGVGTATFTFASDVSFAAGDRLAIIAPTPQDSLLKGVSITLAATR